MVVTLTFAIDAFDRETQPAFHLSKNHAVANISPIRA
jgi:hypothetical protein